MPADATAGENERDADGVRAGDGDASAARASEGACDAHGFDRDVLVVGGGPAGCAAGVFTARYGLDTAVFDRGRSSLQQCAFLENYPGFPAGIDVDTMYDLLHDHAEEAGCDLVADLVASVERASEGASAGGGDAPGFRVETQDGRSVTARRVIAATRYDGEYLRPLDEEGMFEPFVYDGEERERFDRSYAGHDGETPVDGLFVASPSHETDRQAVVAAGRGARVGLAVLGAVRRERGYPDDVAKRYDWVRQPGGRDWDWDDREAWREWFEGRLPDEYDPDDDRLAALREREVDRRMDSYRTDEEIAASSERGQRRLLEHLDDDLVLERARELTGGEDVAGGGERPDDEPAREAGD